MTACEKREPLLTGRTWAVKEAVDEATSRLKHKDIVGKVCTGSQVLGFGDAHYRWDNADCKEKRKMVTDELRNVEEDKIMARAVGMAWMKWESTVPRKMALKTLWKMEPIRITMGV